jgi:hypothetical protein
VVTQYVALAHPSPAFLLSGGRTFSAQNSADFEELLEAFLRLVDAPLASSGWGSGGYGLSSFSISMGVHGFEQTEQQGDAVLQPMLDWVAADPGHRFSVSGGWSTWNASSWRPGQPLPWIEVHPDREISTELLASFTRYLPVLGSSSSAQGLKAAATALARVTALFPSLAAGTTYIMYDKGQAGLDAEAQARFLDTALNPVLQQASGLLLVMYNVPSLPTLPPSSKLLSYLWPRLQKYVVLSSQDPLWAPCSAGAGGDEVSAAQCWGQFLSERVPALQAQLAEMKRVLYEAFPNEDASGAPFSGSYIAETDYEDEEFAVSQWGRATYAKLLAVKAAYDPEGLFFCHHCVGSEAWSPDGNCRK